MQSCSVLLVLVRNSERCYEERDFGCTRWLHNARVCVCVCSFYHPSTTTSQTRLVASHLCVHYASPPGREVFAHTYLPRYRTYAQQNTPSPWSPVCSSAAPPPSPHEQRRQKKSPKKKKASSKDEGGVEAGGALWLPTGWLLAPRPRRGKQGDEKGPNICSAVRSTALYCTSCGTWVCGCCALMTLRRVRCNLAPSSAVAFWGG